MGASKVIENTAYKLVVETDNGAYRLHFTRLYDTEIGRAHV